MPRQSKSAKPSRETSKVSKKKAVKTKSSAARKPVKKTEAKKEESAMSSMWPEKKARPVIVDIIGDDDGQKDDYSLSDYAGRSGAFEYSGSETKSENSALEETAPIASAMPTVDTSTAPISINEIDSQKKFFAELGSEIESRKKEGESVSLPESNDEYSDEKILDLFEDTEANAKEKNQPVKLGLYRRFVWRFVFVVAFLAALVLYFSFSKLTIDIVPQGEDLNESLLLKISSASTSVQTISDPREAISGEIKEISVEAEGDFKASGEEYAGEALIAKVKIINNYGKGQVLIATTRLLSPDNKLFRLKEAVNVPSGGEVWAEVYVDKPSREYAISPTTFTIPGLWVGLQDKIYAKSEEAFVFEEKAEKYVRPSDIAAAEQEISDAMIKKAAEMAELGIESSSSEPMKAIFILDEDINVEVGAKADDRVESFKAKATGKAYVAFFSATEAENLASAKIKLLVPDDKELLEFDPAKISYIFESYDKDSGEATIRSSFSGKMVLKGGDNVIKRESIINLGENQISTYLRSQSGIKDFKLSFFPSFVKRAPRLVDRIEVNIINE